MTSSFDLIGFLGVGHLARTVIAGLHKSGLSSERMMLSPRGQAAAIRTEYGIEVAASNAELVEACDAVILAVRPANAVEAVAGLPWRQGQVLISACAGVTIADLAASAPDAAIHRIMPVTAAAIGASPTACYPVHPAVEDLVARLGPVIPLAREDEFEIATVSAAVYGWVHKLIKVSGDWSAAQGLHPDTARRLAAGIFTAAGENVAASSEPLETLVEHMATPGGITELGLNHLDKNDVGAIWAGACDAVLDRLQKT